MIANNPTLGAHHVEPSVQRKPGTGLFARIHAILVAGREEKGRRIANYELSRFNDSQLLDLGYDKTRIAEIRKYAGPGLISY